MTSADGDGARGLQDRFDTRRLADRREEGFLSRETITEEDRAFIDYTAERPARLRLPARRPGR